MDKIERLAADIDSFRAIEQLMVAYDEFVEAVDENERRQQVLFRCMLDTLSSHTTALITVVAVLLEHAVIMDSHLESDTPDASMS